MKKIYVLLFVMMGVVGSTAQDLLYFNDFELGLGTATVVGNGVLDVDPTPGFGAVFHNAAGGQAVRTNYLLLPDNIFTDLQSSGKKALTIAFWVNKGTAVDTQWTPIFSAYAAAPPSTGNSWPMMVLQSRLVAQVNVGGWSDLVDANNAAGTNKVDVTWLDDANWHYYTAIFTETNVKILVDGVLQNEWNVDGVTDGQVVGGLFTNGSELKYISLGGNQAWNWADPDPAYKFDDVAIFSKALTVAEINAIRTAKQVSTALPFELEEGLEIVSEEFYTLNGARVHVAFDALEQGVYMRRALLSNGAVRTGKFVKIR